MATLASLSNLNGSARGQAALGIMLMRSRILRFLEQNSAFELDATNYDYLAVTGTGTLQSRAVGGGFDAAAKVPPARLPGALSIYGDKITIDRTHRADAAAGLRQIDVWMEREAATRVRDVAQKLDPELMNAPGTGTRMKGLATILNGVDDIPGFTGMKGVADARTIFGGSGNSFDLTPAASAAQHDAFIEGLEKALLKVPDATAIKVNQTLASRITTVARRAHMLGEGRDLFGRPVPTFNGVPILAVSDTTITNAEPDNAGTPTLTTTSLYIERPGERSLSLVTNEGLYYREWEELEDTVSSQEEFELRIQWKIEDPEAILRVRNIKV
jgi:hypothetical protein